MNTDGPTLGVKIFLALVIIGFGAAGYGGLKTYFDNRAAISNLKDRGVETDASVTSVTEVSGRRIETYHKISVAFDPQGPDSSESAEILDCSGNRYDGEGSVTIDYLPDDPSIIRLAACEGSFDSNVLPGIIGLVFGALALLLLWRLRGFWTRSSTAP
ncbi:MAG: hypothetical protein QOG54_205 [Actinomycetota bacterium]|jgi:hypothetical protein|nr:hypothetical protein [Actinomycetota bacterium]